MRSALTVAVASVALLAGCGSDTPTPQATPAPPSVELGAFTPVEVPAASVGRGPFTDPALLAGRMVTIADLPAGYTGYDLPPLDESSPQAEAPDESSTDPASCAAVLAPIATQLPGTISAASVTYGGPDFSSIDQDAASYDGPGAVTAFRTVQDSLAACPEFSGTDADGVRVDYVVGTSPLYPDGVTVGDASFAVRVAVSSEGVSLTTDAVVSLVGSTVSQLVATGTEPVDADLVRGLAQTAAERLAA